MAFDWRIYTYNRWRASAKLRGIIVRMSFDDWWSIWRPHWDRRDAADLVMARNGDAGAYEPGNVRIISRAENTREGFENRKSTALSTSKKPEGSEG